MAVETKNKKGDPVLNRLANDLEEIKLQLRQLILIIPEESLGGYSNSEGIKKAYRKATRSFPPK